MAEFFVFYKHSTLFLISLHPVDHNLDLDLVLFSLVNESPQIHYVIVFVDCLSFFQLESNIWIIMRMRNM